MPKIIMLKGLPACGKSTRATELVKQGYKRINNDDLRDSIDGYKFNRKNEDMIETIRITLLMLFIKEGLDIVVDNTNFNPKCREEIDKSLLARNYFDGFAAKKYEVEEEFIDTPVDECIRRDALRSGRHHVGKNVIKGMYDKYLKKEFVPAEEVIGLRPAIICDIDGTLAKCGDRNIYDASKCHLDTLIKPTLDILERFCDTHTIIICSGRDQKDYRETHNWLTEHNVPFDGILMRPKGDKRKDSIVKQELYDNFIKGKYNIKFVLDDRDQVVQMWRANGLTCHQVAEGNF
jgi:predicted kinase